MGVKDWWNNTARSKRTYSQRSLGKCHCTPKTWHRIVWNRTQVFTVGSSRQATRVTARRSELSRSKL